MENYKEYKAQILAKIELATKGLSMAKDKDGAAYFHNELSLAVEKLYCFTLANLD